MRNDLTDITMVMDRSGSMTACQSDAEGGLNTFIKEQKELPGDAVLTLVQFDTDYEFVHKAMPIKDVPKCYLVPRGWTALLDAVGRAIVETGDRLRKTPEKDRPGLVCFVIITDGLENSSKEFTQAKIKSMIEHQQDKYNWKFTFLGANQDAFSEGGSLGLKYDAITTFNSLTSSPAAFSAASATTGVLRAASAKGDKSQGYGYTTKQRSAMQ
jgi:hypothetical protein